MQTRPAVVADLEALREIDATIDSHRYLHVERSGEGLAVGWRLDDRELRERLIEPNRFDDDAFFTVRQVVGGAEDGACTVVDLGAGPVAAVLVRPRPELGTTELVDLRVDYDVRRQGLGTALLYGAIQAAREAEARAVSARTLTNNHPAAALLGKCGFEICGLDTRRRSNHDLVKEAATVVWYAPLD